MGDPEYCFYYGVRHLHIKLRQKLLTWSGHVESWTHGPEFPVKVVHYEDMHAKPEETFTEAAKFAGLPATQNKIQQAIAAADFQTLKRQENIAMDLTRNRPIWRLFSGKAKQGTGGKR